MSRAVEGASGEVVLYRSPDGQIHLDVRLEHDSVWLTQAQMGKIFKRDQTAARDSPTARWWRSRSSSPKARPRRRTS
jgi:hypothetical protein